MYKDLKNTKLLLLAGALSFPMANSANAIVDTQSISAYQQVGTVSGVVTDAAGPVVGASVIVKGTTNGVITDLDGNFTLSGLKKGDILQISFVGYKTQEITYTGQSDLNVRIKEDTKTLEEVIVVGYGSQRKNDLTGGITSVNNEKLELVSTNNLMDKLAGQVPGLSISATNARPGSEQSLNIRGVNSLSASNSPLIVLDGIPFSGALGDLDPGIIESISVLKDASSAAIYGSRGANGVILIQTKKGKVGKATVTYKGQVGMAQPERTLDMMNGEQYIQYLRDLRHIRNGEDYSILTPEYVLGADEYENYKNGRETDWQDVIFRNALVTNHQIGISGGTEKTTYMASLSHLIQDGVVENTGFKRTNVALNVVQNLNDWLKIGVNMQATQKENGGVQPYLEAAIKMSPYGNPLIGEDGQYNFYPMSRNTLFPNPMADCAADDDNTTRNVFISSFAEIKLPLPGLSFKTNFGYNYRSNFHGTYYGRNTNSGSKVGGSASISNSHYYDYTWENVLRYEKQIKDHKFDITALYSVQETNNRNSSQSADTFVSDDSSYHNMGSGESNIAISSSLTETQMLSYMLRLNYNYKGKYLATITGRSDGYSAFGQNDKYAFFPSVALAWNISSEDFMEKTQEWLDMLKLRASFGSNGNQAINPYQTLNRLKTIKHIWGDGGEVGNGAFLPSNGVGNPNLKWETTKSLNFGIDFSLFHGILTGNLDFYFSKTKDLLMLRSVPYMNGYKSIMDNIGQTKNSGVEFTLNSKNIKTDNFEWNSTLNFSLNRDKITKLTGKSKQDLNNKWFVDQPVRVCYDYDVIGVWQKTDPGYDPERNRFYNADGKEIQKGAEPGAAKIRDTDGDGIISSKDKRVIGSRLPSFLMSLTNNFSYKNFYASFVLNGTFGQWRSMHEYNMDRWMHEFNHLADCNYWTEENPTNEYTRPDYIAFGKHAFYKKVSYVQIKNITVGYNLPAKWAKAIHLTNLRADLSVNNLYTFSNVKNALNYESGSGEYEMICVYPTARSYMFGLNVTF